MLEIRAAPRRAAAFVALALIAGACTGGTPPSGPAASGTASGPRATVGSPTVSAAATRAPATPWELELANVAPDGSRSAASALRLFAMAFGTVPGVDVPADPGPIASGSLAIDEVQAHWRELTRDQQAAIAAALQPPPGSLHGVVGPTSVTASTTVTPGSLTATISIARLTGAITAAATQQQLTILEDAALNMRSQIATKLGGGDGAGPIEVIIPPTQDMKASGYAVPTWDANDVYSGCTLTVEPRTMAAEPINILNTVAHEVFHCFEAAGVRTHDAWLARHAWWAEGGAEWVGDVLGGIDGVSARFWPLWLTAPRNLLFARTYDAEGFFAHLDESGTSPWSIFPQLFAAADDQARFAVATSGSSDAFLDGWASSLVRDPARGPAWDATGPGITDDRVAPEPITIGTSEYEVAVSAYSAADFLAETSEDILQVSFLGHARISDGATDTGSIVSGAFCVRSDGCPDTCPDGSALPEAIPVLHRPFILALSGSSSGAQGTLQGSSIEDFCKPAIKAVQVKDIKDIGGHQVTFADVLSCDGPYGHWTGLFYGIADIMSRTVDFDLGGGPDGTTVAATTGVATTDHDILSVSGPVNVTVQDGGTTMVISGTTDVVFMGPNGPLPPDHHPFSVAYQIEPADPGHCP